jgi:uncharacterized protein (DUF305 family)
MIRNPAGHRMLACALLLSCAVASSAGLAQTNPGDSFAGSMKGAMARMDRDMMAAPSGDADRDFAAIMIAHHQGAIAMAEAELRFGHDPVLRRLAQAIIVEQGQEIAVMRHALSAMPPAANDLNPPTHTMKEH